MASKKKATKGRAVVATGLGQVPEGYAQWLGQLKQEIHSAQQKAARSVNTELVQLYWRLGKEILERQDHAGWGAGIVDRLAQDLRVSFPEMRGLSRSNLLYMRAFSAAWPDPAIVQQLVGQLPWGHNVVLLTKLKTAEERVGYATQALEHGWSRNVLVHQIESRSLARSGTAITNFEQRLPAPQSDLAREALKDPYVFDFLTLGPEANERSLENALVEHLTQFLLELGAGFAYVGRQVHLEVGGDDFYIDLLFYHLKLHCYVAVELKAGDFKPEHTGQLSFYLSAVDAQVKTDQDGPTIGILLCKKKNKVVVEYALRNVDQPMGVAEYQLTESLPENLRTQLPTVEQLEAELSDSALSESPETNSQEAGTDS